MANQAAIFDFDSVLFHETNVWKVKHPAVGILGMAASTADVLKYFQNGILKGQEGKALPEYYSLDHFPSLDIFIFFTRWMIYLQGTQF